MFGNLHCCWTLNVIYFDLDGPILDVAEKYFRTYHDILTKNGFTPIDKFLYWELKRSKTPEKEILELSKASEIAQAYKIDRKNCIETDPYMDMDSLQSGALEVLKRLKDKDYKIILVTLRSSPTQLHGQLKKLQIFDFFNQILSSGAESSPRWKIKFDLITQKGGVHPFKDALFVGDTETDIVAANELGLCSVGVLNGIRNLQCIKDAKPQHVIPGIHELTDLIS